MKLILQWNRYVRLVYRISGATGAGKSTLLDALCLALYDKAPRFATSVESINLADVGDNQINQADVRNLLRRGTSDGYAEVDFQGVDGHRYRSRWSVRRTRNKASGSLQPQVLEVKDLDTEKEFQGTKKELLAQLVDLVGLTYEQFTRTVLLAQNDFATFLKSRGAAKAELLEKLTGTGVYSRISQEIFARNKAVQEEVAMIHNKMSVIELLPEDEFLSLQKEKELLTEKRAAGIKLLAELNAQLNVVRSLKMQETLWMKKQQEEQGELVNQKNLQNALVVQEEGLLHFRAQWEAIQPDLKKGTSVGRANTIATGRIYAVSADFAGCPSAGGRSGEEIDICYGAVADILSLSEPFAESYGCGGTSTGTD